MIQLPEGLDQSVYPLAWFVGEFTGSGKLGGHFGVDDKEFLSHTVWKDVGGKLEYSFEILVDSKPYVTETGTWKVLEKRPQNLTDEFQFPVQANIITTLNQQSEVAAWSSEYLGVVGYGKLELLSDKITLLQPDLKVGDYFVNDLFRSKRMYGWVNDRILWVWDVALVGAYSGEKDELKSIAAGSMLKNRQE